MLPLDIVKKNFGFNFFPDEKNIDIDEITKLPNDILKDILDAIHTNPKESQNIKETIKNELLKGSFEDDSISKIAVPFADITSQRLCYIPYSFLLSVTGSNGMSTGNSREEAVHQALCEIFERYAAGKFFFEQIIPPTIPEIFLKQFADENNIIKTIENSKNYKVIIKDCSLSLNLPVLAVAIIDIKKNMYALKFRADSSFQLALSRTLTEIYQSMSDDETFNSRMIPLPLEELPWFKNQDDEAFIKRRTSIVRFFTTGIAEFPKSFFSDSPTYNFSPHAYISDENSRYGISSFISIIHSLGKRVLIRDTSFLNLPTYYIYVPGMSNILTMYRNYSSNTCESISYSEQKNIAINLQKINNLSLNEKQLLSNNLLEIENCVNTTKDKKISQENLFTLTKFSNEFFANSYMETPLDCLYSKGANYYHESAGALLGKHYLDFLKCLPINSLLLDCGCGPGIESKIASDAGLKVISLDIAKGMLERAITTSPNSIQLLANMTSIPLTNASVDAIISLCSLLHLSRDEGIKALKEFYRIIKPNGLILIATSVSVNTVEKAKPLFGKYGLPSVYQHDRIRENLYKDLQMANLSFYICDEIEIVKGAPLVSVIIAQRKQ